MRKSLWMAAAAMAIFGVAGPALAQRSDSSRIRDLRERSADRQEQNFQDIFRLQNDFRSRLVIEQSEIQIESLRLQGEIARLNGNDRRARQINERIQDVQRSARDLSQNIRDNGRNGRGRNVRFDDRFLGGNLGFGRDFSSRSLGLGLGLDRSFGSSRGLDRLSARDIERLLIGGGSRSFRGGFNRDLVDFGGRSSRFGRSSFDRDFDRDISIRIGGNRSDRRSVRNSDRFSRFDSLGSSRFNRRFSSRDLRIGNRFDSRSFDRDFDRLSERELRDLLRNDRAFGRNGLSRSLGLSGFGNSRFGGSRFSTAFFDRSDFFGRSARSNFRDVDFIRDVRSADRFAAREISRFADDLGGFVGGNRGRQIERQLDRTASQVRRGQR